MAARSKARKRAVDLLFEADMRGVDVRELLADRAEFGESPSNPYTAEVVEGIAKNRHEIDDLLTERSEGWTLARMPAVDRAVLRLAVYELLWRFDVPEAVVIDEAVELAKALSTDDSPRFVNGILAAIVRLHPRSERSDQSAAVLDDVVLNDDLEDDLEDDLADGFDAGEPAAPADADSDIAGVGTVTAGRRIESVDGG